MTRAAQKGPTEKGSFCRDNQVPASADSLRTQRLAERPARRVVFLVRGSYSPKCVGSGFSGLP